MDWRDVLRWPPLCSSHQPALSLSSIFSLIRAFDTSTSPFLHPQINKRPRAAGTPDGKIPDTRKNLSGKIPALYADKHVRPRKKITRIGP